MYEEQTVDRFDFEAEVLAALSPSASLPHRGDAGVGGYRIEGESS